MLGALLAVAAVSMALNLWAWNQHREGNRSEDRGHFAEAFAHYERCLVVWRWSDSLHFRAARSARRAGLLEAAQRHLDACGKEQKSADASLPLALEHLLLRAESGYIAEVEQPLWNYVEKDRADAPLILEGMARGYLRMLRLGAAMRCLHLLLEREPDNIVALVTAGEVVQQGGGTIEEAVKDYRRALELDPQQRGARLKLAQILLHDHAREAGQHFEYLLAQHPNDVESQLGLALALRDLGDAEHRSNALLEKVLSNDPNNSKALSEVGAIALADGRVAEAEAMFRKAIDADRANHLAHFRLYKCLASRPGREDEASEQIAVYERVKADLEELGKILSVEMTRAPNDPHLHYRVGKFYLTYGKPALGLRWLSSALRLDANHQPSHRLLYEYFRQTGDLEQAERHRRQLASDS